MSSTYTAKDITVLEGLEPVRKRPGMYIGGVGAAGLHHLVWEVLDNAIDEAMNGHASNIRVTLHQDASSITVEDDGPGIAEDRIAHVLQRGVRGDERVQGHGIGLAIVQDIVRSYRGELHVSRSQELGGAKFEIVLPPGL